MKNKRITYFNELTQEILVAPIYDEHCYFLGTFTKKHAEKQFMSFNEFSKFVCKKILKIT
jgi:uncharacterized protein YqfB (UPF0267 family)